jgi:hypothetical protein
VNHCGKGAKGERKRKEDEAGGRKNEEDENDQFEALFKQPLAELIGGGTYHGHCVTQQMRYE